MSKSSFQIAHQQGVNAKNNGYEYRAPYRGLLSEYYWKAGFLGFEFNSFYQNFEHNACAF